MIARLRGTLVSREGSRGVIDVADVGYAVTAPNKDLDAWLEADDPVVVHVSTDVREDAITLYGFSDDTDRIAFERLRLVSGVGPKVSLAALDALGRHALVTAVESDDLRALGRIPGVGKKLAQRLALELKGKLPASIGVVTSTSATPQTPAGPDMFALALARLGYTRTEIVRAGKGIEAEGITSTTPLPERVTAALRHLTRG